MINSKLIKENLESLKEEDLINAVLYLIYQATGNPKYSTLSELIYILDKDSLFKLCSVLGGCEIKIPTLLELKLFVGALYVYYAINKDGMKFEDALRDLDMSAAMKKQLFTIYNDINNLLADDK